ncbi:amino acid ABC transporter ATP-binding protein [Weissella diestrammenae]|uniref:Amino acid ABC transporter ATP-binding protein n=1 Tax=Weissella diestrammenae TaxID=1162633 RepID=A0A7G9T4U2_9LACO|nr:ATP-binding cassette domain-containing protein [Weissella diestrammenae]MCM0582830.1 amino acid ABC transporter ATP-binding protein [Weissella diestrammenae]QNN75117.1 amino acid ABC transporter ATP-binding protein [Weissella diestrammenae]
MLEITNLSKFYSERTIFKNLSLKIEPGEVLTIVGPSGIGKTTFLRIIAGLLPANSGSIKLDDELLDISGHRLNAKVGVIFQDFNLFPNYTVKENITLAPITVAKKTKREAEVEASQLLSDLGLSEQADLYPFQLSGGQKQRVAIARALAMHPGILAYDEPTSGLDEESTQRVATVISELKQKGVTQLVVTHDLAFAQTIADETLDFGHEVNLG